MGAKKNTIARIDAWEKKKPYRQKDWQLIMVALNQLPIQIGGTYIQIFLQIWDIDHHRAMLMTEVSVARRLSEMERKGLIEKTGRKALTYHNRYANVYRIKREAIK